jgi:hypothetical protein
MNSEKINKLKDLQIVRPLVIDQNPCVVGFDKPENGEVKVLLNDDEFTMIQFGELIGFNENASMYLSDAFYYRAEINEMLESYVAERVGDYKIEKEN